MATVTSAGLSPVQLQTHWQAGTSGFVEIQSLDSQPDKNDPTTMAGV